MTVNGTVPDDDGTAVAQTENPPTGYNLANIPFLPPIEQAWAIIEQAIARYAPVCVLPLYSAGYDSLVSTHVAHGLALSIPLYTYSINTHLHADGWAEYVSRVGKEMGWDHRVYDNEEGFEEYVKWVQENGCPYSLQGHKRAYNRLKGRAIDAMLRNHKGHWRDKVLFISGIRKAESREREKLTNPITNREGKSNAVFCNPLFYWTDEQVLAYRLDNDLPENPFYETVGGSGDCQCNWGRFITLHKLRKYSPELAAGNVALLDKISRENHGYGWDGTPEGQDALFDLPEDDEGVVIPFLCSGCSRKKSPGYHAAQEERYLQGALL